MLEDVYVTLFTQNVPPYEKLAVVLKETWANVDQFPYGERQDAIDRWRLTKDHWQHRYQ